MTALAVLVMLYLVGGSLLDLGLCRMARRQEDLCHALDEREAKVATIPCGAQAAAVDGD